MTTPPEPRPLRIAVTHATCWPWVRRGSERLLHDLSHWLAGRGHDVTVIATAPEGHPAGEDRDGPVRRLLLPRRRVPAPLARLRWWSFFHGFGLDLRRRLAEGGYDAVHCLGYHDAWGAALARRGGARFRLVFQLTGIPVRRYFRRIPLDGLMFRTAVRRADAVLALSRFAAAALEHDYGRQALLVPAPTDTRPFAATPRAAGEGPPRILFVGDLDEPRKGARLLADAFARLNGGDPGVARLDFSGGASAATRATILAALPEALRGAVAFHGIGRVEELPALYARASVVANPAVWEAQGMVLVEGLAAGAPVVGCDHAGTPDVVDDARIGRLFAPGPIQGRAATDAAALAAALREALALAADPATAALCRARAEAFSWDRVGPLYEAALDPRPGPAEARR